MTTRPFLRVLSALLLAAGLFAVAVPSSPAEASRLACRTSKSVKVNIPDRRPSSLPSIGAKVCASADVLQVELRQRNLRRSGERTALGIDGSFKVVVHSTSSNGRFLNQIVHSDEVWLGNVSLMFSSGTADRYGRVAYYATAKMFEIALPDLQPGIYQIGFELSLSSTDSPDEKVATKVTYVKLKVA
jgi:hypothetical protein